MRGIGSKKDMRIKRNLYFGIGVLILCCLNITLGKLIIAHTLLVLLLGAYEKYVFV